MTAVETPEGVNGRQSQDDTLLKVDNLSLTFQTFEGKVRALDRVSLSIKKGETLGILGESGSGKSTLAFAILSLTPENGHLEGSIEFNGNVVASNKMTGDATVKMKRKQLKMLSEKLRSIRWKDVSIVFQGSMNAFNPVYTIEKQISEIYRLHTDLSAEDIKARVEQTVRRAGLNPVILKSYPHELSGGMKQRAVIAMALTLNPALVIADEPTTGLDVITQAKIITELKRLRKTDIDSMIIISHDVGVVSQLSDKVAVLYAGRLMEFGSSEDIYVHSANPYTKALLESYPSIAKARSIMRGIPGSPPDQLQPVTGCPFASRCLYAQDICTTQDPPFVEISPGHNSLCHFARDIARGKVEEAKVPESQIEELRKPKLEGESTLFALNDLSKFFHLRGTTFGTVFSREGSRIIVRAVESVSVNIKKGEVFAVVGESGSGKTTMGKTLLRLLEPTGGKMVYELSIPPEEAAVTLDRQVMPEELVSVPIDVAGISERHSLYRLFRRDTQLIFQDPYDSLDPKMTVRDVVAEPIIAYKATKDPEEMMEMIKDALKVARLNPPEHFLDRYPHELSGGERQRVAAARALVLRPKFLVADEPISMLDVSLRAGFMNLLLRLRNEEGVTIFYITHDIASARYIADRIMVLYLGIAVELGDSESIIREPLHPYTKALIQAVPLPDPSWNPGKLEIFGEIGSAAFVPKGCRFTQRCPYRQDICQDEPPPRQQVGDKWYLCHFQQSELQVIKGKKKQLADSALEVARDARSRLESHGSTYDNAQYGSMSDACAELEALATGSNDDGKISTKMEEVRSMFHL